LQQDLDQYLTEHREQHLAQYKQFLSIPSVSAKSEHKTDMLRAATFIIDQLQTLGFEHLELVKTTGHPVVYGDWLHAPGKPTILVYAHYDVQPAEPFELWQSPPFEADIRDGMIYARGASDDKSHVMLHLKVCEALLAVRDSLPVNIKFCFEGEEEVGSNGLETLLATEPERFTADLVVISDNSILGPNQPAISYSLRGIAEFQIDVKGANSDLHSGSYGGGVQNAAHALVELLSTMHDAQGRISINGVYDRVKPLSADEREQLARLPFDEDELKTHLGVNELYGEEGYTYRERTTARPTLEINGIYGGYQGEGGKTVIPNEAHAKISCRLVPDQDPEEILAVVKEHIRRHTPKGVTITIQPAHGAHPYSTSIDHPAITLAKQAYEEAYGVPTLFSRMGGSIPIVEVFSRTLHKPIAMLGFALPTCNAHAPNEHFSLDNFDKGLRTLSNYWLLLSEHYTPTK
jgi:Acetylornithine deacetylase/Succinyl-diaminopimelate desuccinylase and related deacylases